MSTEIINLDDEKYSINIENITVKNYKLTVTLRENTYSTLIDKNTFKIPFKKIQELLGFVEGNSQYVSFELKDDKLFVDIDIPFSENKLSFLLQEEMKEYSCQEMIMLLKEEMKSYKKDKKVWRVFWINGEVTFENKDDNNWMINSIKNNIEEYFNIQFLTENIIYQVKNKKSFSEINSLFSKEQQIKFDVFIKLVGYKKECVNIIYNEIQPGQEFIIPFCEIQYIYNNDVREWKAIKDDYNLYMDKKVFRSLVSSTKSNHHAHNKIITIIMELF